MARSAGCNTETRIWRQCVFKMLQPPPSPARPLHPPHPNTHTHPTPLLFLLSRYSRSLKWIHFSIRFLLVSLKKGVGTRKTTILSYGSCMVFATAHNELRTYLFRWHHLLNLYKLSDLDLEQPTEINVFGALFMELRFVCCCYCFCLFVCLFLFFFLSGRCSFTRQRFILNFFQEIVN